MTLDQIRTKREEAETAIRNILEGLRQETGLCPLDAHVNVLSVQSFGQPPHRSVQSVDVVFEAI